ncbi:MAG: hypothetical protein R3C42_03100 [Parvularculaceae bacterium]|nr:hypothetical protein [Parvularculaceae bacterium]
MRVNAVTPFGQESGASDISLYDLVSLHAKITQASGALSPAARFTAGSLDETGDASSDARVLEVLLREEKEQLDWRRQLLAREIRAAIPRTRFEQLQKLRFELNNCGEDEIAAEAALAGFLKIESDPMHELGENATIELVADGELSRTEMVESICEELALAERAVQLLCGQRPELQGLKSLIARSVARLESMDDEPYPYALAAE